MRYPRIYLSGKIAGLPREEATAHFAKAERRLQRQKAWEVVNPIKIMSLDDFDWADFLLRDLQYLRHCEAIYMLEGWETKIIDWEERTWQLACQFYLQGYDEPIGCAKTFVESYKKRLEAEQCQRQNTKILNTQRGA